MDEAWLPESPVLRHGGGSPGRSAFDSHCDGERLVAAAVDKHSRGGPERAAAVAAQPTFGSLKASISPLNASTGTQLQNTFLSP